MTKSAAEIEREVELARGNVENTVEALKERMTPGQIVDQFTRSFSESGGAELVTNLGQQVRDNPLPLALIGAGIAWLMFGSAPRRSADYPVAPYHPVPYDEGARPRGVMGTVGDVAGTVSHGVARAGSTVGGAASTVASGVRSAGETLGSAASTLASGVRSAGEVVGDAASAVAAGMRSAAETVADVASTVASGVRSAGSTVGEAASAMASGVRSAGGAMSSAAATVGSGAQSAGQYAGSTLSGTTGTIQESAEAAYRSLRSGAHDVTETAMYYGSRARRTFVDTLNEEPFVIGALGIAVGAALGAMLPSTEAEERYLGEYGEKAWEQAKGMARQAVDQAVDVAETAYSQAKAEAERQGLTDVSQLTDKIEKVAQAGVEAARDEASKKTEELSRKADEGPRPSPGTTPGRSERI